MLKQAELGMAVTGLIRKPDQARLKKLVADLSLDKAILRDVAPKEGGSPR